MKSVADAEEVGLYLENFISWKGILLLNILSHEMSEVIPGLFTHAINPVRSATLPFGHVGLQEGKRRE
jgi:hypothetical protein